MDPNYELSRAVIAALKTAPDVTRFTGTRIFDRVPADPKPAFPYISMGPSDSLPDDADCIDGEEISIQIDCWSQGAGEAFGSAEVKKLAGAVKRSFHDAGLGLADNALLSLHHRATRIMREPDGITNHAALSFTAFVEIG
ncbi:DUF3168 domain-containing protein [Martelella mangrovi]|uniref:DUF3168 domain-containing protein n=1 Tax=Martelella mangrovi TaxID=1397477 RepID=A0ABV2IGH2_9HYPH